MHERTTDFSEDVLVRLMFFAMLVLLLGVSCGDPAAMPQANEGPGEPPTDLASAQEAWRHAGITDYTMDVKVTGCFCPQPLEYTVTVVDGQVTEHTSPPDLKHPEDLTVELLFSWLGQWGANDVQATYNEYGVPIEAHVDAPNVADEQADYAVTFQAGV